MEPSKHPSDNKSSVPTTTTITKQSSKKKKVKQSQVSSQKGNFSDQIQQMKSPTTARMNEFPGTSVVVPLEALPELVGVPPPPPTGLVVGEAVV